MKDYFLKYGIVLGKRYTLKQKMKFIEVIAADFIKAGYNAEVKRAKRNVSNVINLYIGNVEKAEVIFIAAYDTGSKIYLPNYLYYPFNPEKNIDAEKKNNLLIWLISLVSLAPLNFLTRAFAAGGLSSKLLCSGLIALIVLLTGKFMGGFANSVNYSGNSASVVLIRALCDRINNGDKAAFILADHGVSSYAGFKVIAGDLGSAADNKLIILLDSLASGDITAAVYRENASGEMEKLKAFSSGLDIYDKAYSEEKANTLPIGLFKNSIAFACGNNIDKQLCVSNTRTKHDYSVDLERLDKLREMFVSYINNV